MTYLAWDCGRYCVLITGGNGRLLDSWDIYSKYKETRGEDNLPGMGP